MRRKSALDKWLAVDELSQETYLKEDHLFSHVLLFKTSELSLQGGGIAQR